MRAPRILFVDDEPNIRLTLPAILRSKGFEVEATSCVAEALAAMQAAPFDVLLTDLNIGQPGDGFTVVSAMRRTQPQAVTIILTGYPAFETALEAIRNQVDDYFVKPANIEELISMISTKLESPPQSRQHHIRPRRLGEFLQEHEAELLARLLAAIKKCEELANTVLADSQRIAPLSSIIEELENTVDPSYTKTPGDGVVAGATYGRIRREQGYTLPMLTTEIRLLRHEIYCMIQENLLAMNISFVITEMIQVGEMVDCLLHAAIESFVTPPQKVQAP